MVLADIGEVLGGYPPSEVTSTDEFRTATLTARAAADSDGEATRPRTFKPSKNLMEGRLSDYLLSWASILDPQTEAQSRVTAELPMVEGHVALMPDAHLGIGATAGSVADARALEAAC